jgi:hypothetical protein
MVALPVGEYDQYIASGGGREEFQRGHVSVPISKVERKGFVLTKIRWKYTIRRYLYSDTHYCHTTYQEQSCTSCEPVNNTAVSRKYMPNLPKD